MQVSNVIHSLMQSKHSDLAMSITICFCDGNERLKSDADWLQLFERSLGDNGEMIPGWESKSFESIHQHHPTN